MMRSRRIASVVVFHSVSFSPTNERQLAKEKKTSGSCPRRSPTPFLSDIRVLTGINKMLQQPAPGGQKRLQSHEGPRSPLNTVTKDFNSPFPSNVLAVPKLEPGLSNETSDRLGVLAHEGAVPCLPYAGEQLSGLIGAPLPFTRQVLRH